MVGTPVVGIIGQTDVLCPCLRPRFTYGGLVVGLCKSGIGLGEGDTLVITVLDRLVSSTQNQRHTKAFG